MTARNSGVTLRVPRRDVDTNRLSRDVDNARTALIGRASRARRRAAAVPDSDSLHAATLRAKAVAYKEAADLLASILNRP